MERYTLLENEASQFNAIINPHQLSPGMILIVNVTSIKLRKTTLDSTAAVLNEFLGELGGALSP